EARLEVSDDMLKFSWGGTTRTSMQPKLVTPRCGASRAILLIFVNESSPPGGRNAVRCSHFAHDQSISHHTHSGDDGASHHTRPALAVAGALRKLTAHAATRLGCCRHLPACC